MSLESYYSKMNYKALMLIPLLIIIFSIGFLGYTKSTTDEWVGKSIDLRGGSQLTFSGDYDKNKIESHLILQYDEIIVRETRSLSGNGIVIEAGDASQQELLDSLGEIGIVLEDFSFQEVGPSLGESFFRQSVIAVIFAFIFMAFAVLIIFRKLIPSLAVIQGAATDVVGTLAFMNLLGIDLSLASFAGLLLVIGYSIDTDILLTTRLLKREGSVIERSISAMKTGFLMTGTTLIALVILYFAADVAAIRDIASVLIIALLIDLPATWLMNLGIIRWWRKE